MPRCEFHFAGHAIRVEGPPEPLLWLAEFLAPQFSVANTEEPDQTIRFIVDAGEHARLVGHGPHPQHLTTACFTLDSGIVSARVWQAPDDIEVAFDEARDVFYRRRSWEPRAVEVIAVRDAGPARVAVMRAVREYAMAYASRGGWLIAHAAAVCIGRDAFVIAGPKRAGKTTLLLHALRHEHGAYVSNDRVALRSGPAGVTVYGIPTIVSIRRDSTAWFGDLDATLAAVGYDARQTLAERRSRREVSAGAPATTWNLSPKQLCHLLAVESRASARVARLLFPRVDTRPGGATLEELSLEQASDALHGAMFRPGVANGMFRIDETMEAESEERSAALAARIASQVGSDVCRLGPAAYSDGTRWLSRLGGADFPAGRVVIRAGLPPGSGHTA